MWSGTETRDPAGAQHLQNYESYNIINYFQRISNGRNGGGWVDAGGINMSADRYAEQLWLTMFAKAPEIALFEWSSLATNTIKPEWKAPWQGTGTSFDWDEMMVPFKKDVTPTTLAGIAGYTLEKTDKVVSQLGNPLGIKSYKCYHTQGDDFLQNYLGMIGLPMDMVSEFPTDQKVVLLTEQAKSDPDLVKKIDAQLRRGGDVVITSGLLEAIPDKIAQFAELTIDGKALVNDFGRYGKSDKDILTPMTPGRLFPQAILLQEVPQAGRFFTEENIPRAIFMFLQFLMIILICTTSLKERSTKSEQFLAVTLRQDLRALQKFLSSCMTMIR